jgi:hypothetical protein
MKKAAVVAVAVPTVVYTFGQWALANEGTLLSYFSQNSGMYNAINTLLEWLRALPLA